MANPLICVFNPVTSFIDEVQSVSSGPATNGIPIVTNLLGVIDTSLLGIGSIATAGQTISAGALVNLYSFAGTLHAQIATAQSPTFPNPTPPTPPSGGTYPLQAQGFAASSASLNAPFTVSFFGTFKYIDGNAEFNASSIGQEVYLSDRGDGSPTLTPPSGGGELEQSVGYVVAFASPNVVTVNFASGFQDFSHISGVNPITKGGTGATTAPQALINLIGSGTTGQAVVWSGTAWVPGFDNSPFNQITSGTNTTAAMIVSTGASLSFSGSGTINANQLTGDPVNTSGRVAGNALVWNGSAWAPSGATMTSFTDITSGTNTTATMTVGTGATLTFSPTGIINANQLYNVVISNVAPSVGQVLTATGASAADWQNIVAGPTNSLQINNGSNAFAGYSNLTYNHTTDVLAFSGQSLATTSFTVTADGNGTAGGVVILEGGSGGNLSIDFNNSITNGIRIMAQEPASSGGILLQNNPSDDSGAILFIHSNSALTEQSVEINANGIAIGNGGATPKIGFFGSGPVVQPTVTGARDGNAAVASLLTALSGEGLVVDTSTAGTAKADLYDQTGASPAAGDNHIASGTAQLTAGTVTVTLTGNAVFTLGTTYVVQLTYDVLGSTSSNNSARAILQVTNTDGAHFIINNSDGADNTSVVNWTAIGY